MLKIKSFAYNPFQTNTYILSDESGEAIVIDPSFAAPQEEAKFDAYVNNNNLKLVGVYNTHLHFDHCFGVGYLKKEYGLEYAAHPAGLQFIKGAAKQASVYGVQISEIEAPTLEITELDIIKFGNNELRILNTPGHANGSLCFVSDSDHFVITGDVLFRESIGRTDLPTGDLDLLLDSIHNKLFVLDGDYKVYPGHGPSTTIAEEISGNPFLIFGEIH
ncbi:MAG: MBL fold metallo-hydrolase [Bacteroidales bacterium]|nr:MBL fold metallo-hydrolase [Bacteroidales bacterium]